MKMEVAVLGLFIFMLLYLLICEFFTVLFRLTGVNENIARFQVISMLSGCGYTTSESELITKHKRRRDLAFITILFGYIFTATIISVVMNLINNIIHNKDIFSLILQGSLAITLVAVIWLSFLKINFVKTFFDKIISFIAVKLMFIYELNPIIIQAVLNDDEVVAELKINALLDTFKDMSVNEICKNYKIVLLKSSIDKEEFLKIGDSIIVFAHMQKLRDIFQKEE